MTIPILAPGTDHSTPTLDLGRNTTPGGVTAPLAPAYTAPIDALRGRRVLVLNWRDVRHSQAGGAELYMHQIARRWVAAGVVVTWMTAREPGAACREVIDGIEVRRAGGPLGVYVRTAVRLLRTGRRFDVIVDCQNGIPFFSPVFTGWAVPTVQVVHHVHQDQFTTRFSPPMAALGRFLERRAARGVYRDRPIAAVSASTRQELRRRLRFRGPIFIVPNGTLDVPALPGPRTPDPTVVVVSRMVVHKRIDLLVRHVAAAAARLPRLRVEIVGDGPELPALRRLVTELGMDGVVTFHGRQSDAVRDELLRCAWLTVSLSDAEGWGCSVIEAAAWGVPCLARDAAGIRDSVVDTSTGWLVGPDEDFAATLVTRLHELADDEFAARVSATCQAWARHFSWDRAAALLAGVLVHEIGTDAALRHGPIQRRTARSDAYTVARFTPLSGVDSRTLLRVTDEVHMDGDRVTALLGGCDEFDALEVLTRRGVRDLEVRPALRCDLLAGPPRFLPGVAPSRGSTLGAGENR